MKVFTPNKFILNLLLFLLSFEFILNTGCNYKKTKEGSVINTDDEDILNGIAINSDEAKQKCFSLSHSESQTGKCCYKDEKCEAEATPGALGEEYCAKDSIIFNNCGMAGVYQPLTKEICTEISLVQGYCCFVKTKTKGNACIRTKELNKEKNTATDQIKNYVKGLSINPDEIESVLCKGNYIKYYWLFIIFAVIFLK